MKTITIIGSGFSSLSAACYLAKAGFKVDVYEKNDSLGGRARLLEKEGFRFDMGPSWYWMPDVFERFFADFEKKPSDYYELIRLSPAYKVFFDDEPALEVPASLEETFRLFESVEAGSAGNLASFMKDAQYNYDVAIRDLVYKPGLSPLELITPRTIKKLNHFFVSIRHEIRRRFKNEKLIRILEFPVLFLGAKPDNTPAFYSFMNYADLSLGTWYPKGGMYEIVKAMHFLGKQLGVKYHTGANVEKIIAREGIAVGVKVDGKVIFSDIVLSGADYQHSESLVDPDLQAYSKEYWEKRTFAPSALLFYTGFNKKLENLRHHNLFFDKDFDKHAKEIYDNPSWPSDPLFYASFPSITDDSVAPRGMECGIFLIPLAPGLEDNEEKREQYFDIIMNRLEEHTGQSIKKHIVYRQSYCVSDFMRDYNAYKGNAYGMANTLRQTAFMRPGIKSKRIQGLYFTGQLTVPGPGVPPALISGKIAAQLIIKETNKIVSDAAAI